MPAILPVTNTATPELQGLLERERIVDRVTELFLATDRKDWAAVERSFTNNVDFDMSSAGGGPAARTRASAIAEGWRTGLAAIEKIHHQAGNFVVQVSDSSAEARCYGLAYHYRKRADGRNTRVFVGSYEFKLERLSDGWRIRAMRFILKFVDGNAELEAPE